MTKEELKEHLNNVSDTLNECKSLIINRDTRIAELEKENSRLKQIILGNEQELKDAEEKIVNLACLPDIAKELINKLLSLPAPEDATPEQLALIEEANTFLRESEK